jgi:hypothetical protein
MGTAKNEILALVKTALEGASEVPDTVLWPDVTGKRPTSGPYWADVMLRHEDSEQTSLAGRHTNYGRVMIDLYYPGGDGQTNLDTLAQEVTNALRGQHTAGGVWFRSVTPREIGEDGPWFRYTVTGVFQYDQF